MRKRSLRAEPVHLKRVRIGCKFVGINQSTTGFVVGVCREAVIHIKPSLSVDGLSVTSNQSVHLFLCWFRTRNGIRSGQTRKILSKTVPRNESVQIAHGSEVGRIVIPASHFGTGSWHACT